MLVSLITMNFVHEKTYKNMAQTAVANENNIYGEIKGILNSACDCCYLVQDLYLPMDVKLNL